jgi:exonuclease SbcD
MRLVHIADLHAGKTLGRINRNPDLDYALDQVIDFVKENGVNGVLMAGDIFDKANPDNESKELIFDFFLRLKSLGCEAVVISGNHDSYDFMKSISGLTRLANVHVFDRPSKENFLHRLGDVVIACLPYPSERVLTPAQEDSKRSYGELVSRFIAYLAQRAASEGDKRILLAHLFVAGSLCSKTEKVASVTLHYAVQPSSLDKEFDYVALGHVHRYQRIEGAPTTAFYTGSMFQLDFSESEDKAFNFLVFEEDLRLERIPLSLKNILKEVTLNQSNVVKTLGELKEGRELLKIRLVVEKRDGLNHTVDLLKKELGERLARLELNIPVEKEALPPPQEGLDPVSLYREYFRAYNGRNLPEDIENEFVKVLKEAEDRL